MELPRDYDKKTKEIDVDGKDLLDFKSSESNDTDVKVGEGNKTKSDLPGPKTPENSTILSIEISRAGLSDNKFIPKAIVNIYDPRKESSISGTFDELQSEIDNTATGFVLNLYKDYKGQSGSRVHLNKDLTINGHGHTIDCLGKKGCSAFYSNSGNIVLKNLIIINGHNDYTNKGGAIFIEGTAKYTLINCSLIDNWADDFAGAIYNDGGHTLTLKNCLFRGNTADDDDGGAIFTNDAIDAENTIFEDNKAEDYAGAVYINCNKYSQFKNCVFKYNVAGDDNGGAINSKAKLYLKNCTFDSNKAKVDGGAICCDEDVQAYGCLFKNNQATGAKSHQCYGGAIRSKKDVYVEACDFIENSAEDYGGAIYAKNIYINLLMKSKSLFRANSANDDDGGALYAEGDVDADNVTLEKNKSYEDGGAIFCKNAKLRNADLAYNRAEGASACWAEGGAIYARDDVNLYENCYIYENFAHDIGGAITCDNINFYHPSIGFWESTTDRDGGMYSCPVYIGDIKYDGEFEVNASHANCYF